MRAFRILGPFLFTAAVALACGDKLMLIMRVRLAQLRLGHPISILALAQPDLPSSASIRRLQLQPAVKKAGHRIQIVDDRAHLDEALRADKYDLILADLSVAGDLTERTKSVPNRPMVVPIAYNTTKAEASATQKKFHCVLKLPGDSDQYFDAVDQALQWKAKTFAR